MKKGKKETTSVQYAEGQNLFDINAQDTHIKKYQSEILNLVNKHGRGNDAKIVGMVSQVIKDYRANTDEPSLDGWKQYHQGLADIRGIDAGVESNWIKFQEMKNAIDLIDKDTIQYWLENLVYNKTFAGLQAQDIVLNDIANRLTKEKGDEYSYRNGDSDDEKAQIDGYIIAPDNKVCGLQVKSDTYKSHNTIEGIAPVQYVYYNLNANELTYTFNLDNLKFVDEEEYTKIKDVAKEKEKAKQEKIKEKERKKEERENKRAERLAKKEERERRKTEKLAIKEAKVKLKANNKKP
ncbi:MAG: MjaI family restriction endonuclease [Alistipes sp.]|nr:MjaI family restriction endonuclease [Alistipes sp.]